MKISENAFVEIEYVLTIDSDVEVDRSDPEKPLIFIYGADQIVPGLEKKLSGMEVGENAKLVVEAKDGYGEHNPELLRELPRKNFPEDVEINNGMVFQAQTPHGLTNFTIAEVNGETIKADFNHPLAGKILSFDVKVITVRKATEEDAAALSRHSECTPSCCSECAGEETCESDKKPE